MKYTALTVLAAVIAVGCNRDTFKTTEYSRPINEETINSTNGLYPTNGPHPKPRFDTFEGRPPSERLGVKGTSSEQNIQSAAESEQNRNRQGTNQ